MMELWLAGHLYSFCLMTNSHSLRALYAQIYDPSARAEAVFLLLLPASDSLIRRILRLEGSCASKCATSTSLPSSGPPDSPRKWLPIKAVHDSVAGALPPSKPQSSNNHHKHPYQYTNLRPQSHPCMHQFPSSLSKNPGSFSTLLSNLVHQS